MKSRIDDMRTKGGLTEDGNEYLRVTERATRSPLYYSGLDMISPLSGFLPDKRAILKYESADSWRWSDAYLEMKSENDVHPITQFMQLAYRPSPEKLVGGGAWVIINRNLPLSKNTRPERWGIYWAIPCRDSKNYDGYDEGGMYKVNILVPAFAEDPYSGLMLQTGAEYVSAYPHEYIVMRDPILFKEETEDPTHYTLQQLNSTSEAGMDMELIERGRTLTEEERESIWALMLDGLSELQACQEYFLSRHMAEDNSHIWYKPTPELVEAYDEIFGSMIESIGQPLKPRRSMA